jgi:uncharacterized membrane protein
MYEFVGPPVRGRGDTMADLNNKTSIGVDANVAGLLCYVLGWVSGLALFLLEKDNDTVRFHAMQSMITFGAVTLLNIVFGPLHAFGYVIVALVNVAALALWVLLMVKAYQGERFRLPVVGELAEQWLRKLGV